MHSLLHSARVGVRLATETSATLANRGSCSNRDSVWNAYLDARIVLMQMPARFVEVVSDSNPTVDSVKFARPTVSAAVLRQTASIASQAFSCEEQQDLECAHLKEQPMTMIMTSQMASGLLLLLSSLWFSWCYLFLFATSASARNLNLVKDTPFQARL